MIGVTMSSALALWLRAEISRRGWTDSELSDRAGFSSRSTLSRILNKPEQVPKLETLAALAKALDEPLNKLITLCGFHLVGTDDEVDQAKQVALLLETMPELAGLFDTLLTLRPDDIRAIRAYVDGISSQQKKHEEKQLSQ